MNIVSLIMQYLAPAMLGKIASALGVSSPLAQKAIAAAIPAILGGLMGKVSQPGGGQILSDILGKQDPGLLGKLGDMIGGAQQKTVVDQGTNVLGSLLGNSAMGSLAGALGKYAGLGDGPSKSLLGMLAPVVLGQLGAQQKSAGLDAGGLAKMLMGQKDNIQAALPGDFAKLLGGTGLLDSLQTPQPSLAQKATTAATGAATSAGHKMSDTAGAAGRVVHDATHHGHHAFNWWPWAIAIGLAGLLWWTVFGNRVMQPALAPLPTQKILAGNVDLGQEVASVIETLRGTAGGIRDVASAQTALPRMQDAAAKLDRVGALAGGLPPDAKRALASYVGQNIGAVSPALNALLSIPGVGPILKPVIDQLLGRMSLLSRL